MSTNDLMEIGGVENTASSSNSSTATMKNASQSQIAQKQWELSNYIQGWLLNCFLFHYSLGLKRPNRI